MVVTKYFEIDQTFEYEKFISENENRVICSGTSNIGSYSYLFVRMWEDKSAS